MFYYWLKDNVICYKQYDRVLTDTPELTPLQIQTLLNKIESIKKLYCIERDELPTKHLFVSIRLYKGNYLWELNNIYKTSIIISNYRSVCDYLKSCIENAIDIYLSDSSRNIVFRTLDIQLKEGTYNVNVIPEGIPIKNTTHLIMEINNPVRSICLYIRILKGLITQVQTYQGDFTHNNAKIKRRIREINNLEQLLI